MTPPWLPLSPDLPGREDAISAGLRALDRSAIVGIVGPPGVGKTSVAGAMLARSGRAGVGISFVGCESGPDAMRALGDALGARPRGNELAVTVALRKFEAALVVADDVASEDVLDTLQQVVAAVPGTSALVVSETAYLSESIELGDVGENPLLARVAAAMGLSIADALTRISRRAGALVAFPMGLPADAGLGIPAVALRPDLRDRAVLRRGVAVHLTPGADAVESALSYVGSQLALARGAHLDDSIDIRDALLFRALARSLPTRVDGAMCMGVAARLVAVAGQVDVARQMIQAHADGVDRGPSASDAHAMLLWADGDVLLLSGEVDDALRRFRDAAERFHRTGAVAMHATLLRRTADRLAVRSEIVTAEEGYRQARAIYRALGDHDGVAATLRGAADLSVCSGEWVSAGALHEQIAEQIGDAVGAELSAEWMNLRMGQASLATARGEYAAAEVMLASLSDAAAREPLLRANVFRRKADLLLRRGQHDGASSAADQAASLYAQVGEGPAQAAAMRLGADIAAAAGKLADARSRYRKAMLLQVRLRSMHGLARTLSHAAALEEALGNIDGARRMRAQRGAVVEAMGED